ncbi:DUF711 family protein [Candidatus Pyrohabitans sp.]
MLEREEILETLRMILVERLDIRTVTLGVSLKDCASSDTEETCERIEKKLLNVGERLVSEAKALEEKYGIAIVNKRVAVTPLANIISPSLRGLDEEGAEEAAVRAALALERAAERLGVDFIGGFSALVEKGFTRGDEALISAIPEALSKTQRVCSSVNVASTRAGINMDAVLRMGEVVKRTSELDYRSCARLVTFANAPGDNPFMAGAFHGEGEGEAALNVGISGPGVVRAVLEKHSDASLGEVAEVIKRTAFKITRVGELIGRELSRRLGVSFGIVDLSLAPTPFPGDSVAKIIEAMGIARCGAPGSVAALALLVDAVKKGGTMATSYVGGLSGAFIPVSEDAGMAEAAKEGAVTIDKLLAMTSVCSVGLDMLVLPAKTSASTVAGLIADEAAIGVMNSKTTGVRVILAGKEGERIDLGGLLGYSYVMPVSERSCEAFVRRGGRIPSPIHGHRN